MKLTIQAGQFRDRHILVELFDIAIALYKQSATDPALAGRTREQFDRQARDGGDLTMQLWHQRSYHEITFRLEDLESSRWLVMNMMTTGIEELSLLAETCKSPPIKALLLQRIARAEQLRERAEQLREMVDDASGHA